MIEISPFGVAGLEEALRHMSCPHCGSSIMRAELPVTIPDPEDEDEDEDGDEEDGTPLEP